MSDPDINTPLGGIRITADVDYPSLLYEAFDAEDEELQDSALPAGSGAADVEPSPSARRPSGAVGDKDEQPSKKPKYDPSQADGAVKHRPQSRQHKRRSRLRDQEIVSRGYSPSASLSRKHLGNALSVKTALDTIKLPAAHGAYTALNKPAPRNPKEIPDLKKLVDEEGFQYIKARDSEDPENDSGRPRPIVDRNGLIIAHIASPPKDLKYKRDTNALFEVIIEESDSTFSKNELNHKRGNFPAVNFGFTLPNGFTEPRVLDEGGHKEKISRIRSCPGFEAVSNFQNSVFAFWNPGVYQYQKTRVEQVLSSNCGLKRTTPKTIFPTTACNFRNVCCFQHRDTQNCPFGWCAITALGRFDHTLGGHLILWELKLIIEFPHGYTILIPSATITHSNTPVADGDVRVSITQYCAGSLLRYADNHFNTDKALREKNKALFENRKALKEYRWREALDLLSTIEDLNKRKQRFIPSMFQ